MGHFGISFPEFFRRHIVIQDSIFGLIELFFIVFENLVNCLLRSPGSLFIPFIGALSLCCFFCTFLFNLCLVSAFFLLLWGSVLHGRPGWLLSKFREMYLAHHPQALCSIAPLLSSTVGSIDSPTVPSFTCIFRFAYCSFQYLFALWLVKVHVNKITIFHPCQDPRIAGIGFI